MPVLATRLARLRLAVLLDARRSVGLCRLGAGTTDAGGFPDRRCPMAAGLIIAWALALAFMALATNALWYCGSRFAFAGFGLPAGWNGISTPAAVAHCASAGSWLSLGVLAYLRIRRDPPAGTHAPSWSCAPGCGAGRCAAPDRRARGQAIVASTSPNIIILGVDSLRNDLRDVDLVGRRRPGSTPFLSQVASIPATPRARSPARYPRLGFDA